MSEGHQNLQKEGHTDDWFIPAILSEGTVDSCLSAVLSDLNLRASFTQALKTCFSGRASHHGKSIDSVTLIGEQARRLEKTLSFRLGLLRPERAAAWFRPIICGNMGPLMAEAIPDPIFSPYLEHSFSMSATVDNIVQGFSKCWNSRTMSFFPLQSDQPSLWKMLLSLNAELEAAVKLPAPFEGLRLDVLPEGLPQKLESKLLKSFLLNVKREVLSTRKLLDECFERLWKVSESLWLHQKRADREVKKTQETADSVRQEFKKRRRAGAYQFRHGGHSGTISSPMFDLDALQFMGFNEYPSIETLRQRYLLMAKKLHPDRDGGSEEAFKMLNKVYRHLTKRLFSYEKSGSAGLDGVVE